MNYAQLRGKGRGISDLLFRNKYLIISSAVLFILSASAYLFFLSPKYQVRIELSISADWESPWVAMNELRSAAAIEKAVKSLGLEVSYYHKGIFHSTEICADSLPIKFIPGKGSIYDSPTEIKISLIDANGCRVDQNNVLTDVPFYHPVKHASLNYTIEKGPAFKPIQPPLTVKLTPYTDLTELFNKSLNAKLLSNDSFELSLKTDNLKKGQDFLNKLVEIINKQHARVISPIKLRVIDTLLLAKLNDSITYYIATVNGFRQQQYILNNIKKPRQMPKLKPKPKPAPAQIPMTDKEKTDLNALTTIKSYTSQPNDPFVLIPNDHQVNDNRIDALIQNFNKAQVNKQRAMQDSDNADASVYAFKLELNSAKEALINSITAKEQKIRAAHHVRDEPQPQDQEVEEQQVVEPPKDTKSIASFLSLQLTDSIDHVNAIIKLKEQQYKKLLYGSDIRNSDQKLTITEKSSVRESIISESLLIYLFALLAGLLLPALLLIITGYITSANKMATH